MINNTIIICLFQHNLYSLLLRFSLKYGFLCKIRLFHRNVLKKVYSALVMMQKVIITTNMEVFRNDRFVLRVGLNLISQHIKLGGKTNKYALFSLLETYIRELGPFAS